MGSFVFEVSFVFAGWVVEFVEFVVAAAAVVGFVKVVVGWLVFAE